MKELLYLNLRISLAIAIFYLVYLLFMSKDTFFTRNRFYLLFALVVAIIIPMLKIPVYVAPVVAGNQPLANANPIIIIHDGPTSNKLDIVATLFKGLFITYLAGVLFMLVKLSWGISRIVRMASNAKREYYDNMIIVKTQQKVSPFSFYKWLIISDRQWEQQDVSKILQHEMVHYRQFHAFDLIVAEVIRAFQWFNPFAWLAKKAIVQNHEFIVDQQLLLDGLEPKVYQYSLLNTIVQGQKFSFVNHFNTNLLKKRITMMNKCESPRWYGVKNVMILISLSIVVSLTATFETKVIAQKNQSGANALLDPPKKDSIEKTEVIVKKIRIKKDTLVVDKQVNKEKHKEIVYVFKDSIDAPSSSDRRIEEVVEVGVPSKDGEEKEEKIIIKKKIGDKEPICIIDGKRITMEELKKMDPSLIASIEVWKNESAIKEYGDEGKNGVVKVKTKSIMINNGVKTGLTISQTGDNVEGIIIDENKIKPDAPYVIKVTDNKGNTAFEAKTTEKAFKIPLSKLKEGDYFISVVNAENHYSCSSNYTFKHK